jgi:hypothetical protein
MIDMTSESNTYFDLSASANLRASDTLNYTSPFAMNKNTANINEGNRKSTKAIKPITNTTLAPYLEYFGYHIYDSIDHYSKLLDILNDHVNSLQQIYFEEREKSIHLDGRNTTEGRITKEATNVMNYMKGQLTKSSLRHESQINIPNPRITRIGESPDLGKYGQLDNNNTSGTGSPTQKTGRLNTESPLTLHPDNKSLLLENDMLLPLNMKDNSQPIISNKNRGMTYNTMDFINNNSYQQTFIENQPLGTVTLPSQGTNISGNQSNDFLSYDEQELKSNHINISNTLHPHSLAENMGNFRNNFVGVAGSSVQTLTKEAKIVTSG